jgi:hypothetical protein
MPAHSLWNQDAHLAQSGAKLVREPKVGSGEKENREQELKLEFQK